MKEHIEIEYNQLKMRGYHQRANSEKVIIILHGIGGNKLGHKFVFKQMADKCAAEGISTIRLDFIGSGESDGEFEEVIHSNQVDQLLEIIKKARQEFLYSNIYLCSTTIGCYSAWHAAQIDGNIKAVINWNPIANFDRYYEKAQSKVDFKGGLDYNGLYSAPQYIEDLKNLKREIPKLDIPVLLLQGELDGEAKFPDAKNLANRDMWKYKMVSGGNHLWDGLSVRDELFSSTISFVNLN